MSFEPDPLQRLLLWRLAVSDEGGEFLKELDAKSLDATRRRALIREGLVEDQPRKIGGKGRALSYLELTDKGWAWCQGHLGEAFKFRGAPPKLAGIVLERLLALLKDYFESQNQTSSFGEFVLQARSKRAMTASPSEASARDGHSNGVADQIRHACLDLAQGRENARVRLADLRRRLAAVDRRTLDQALLQMERAGELSLYELNDPREIGDTDRDAVLRTAAGNERHVVYFGGLAS